MKKEISMQDTTRVSRPAVNTVTVSFIGAALSLLLIAALHILKPEFDPSWRFLSEYANGRFGWVMRLSFFSMAVSCASLFLAIRVDVKTLAGKIGLAFLLAAFVGLTMAGMFAMDLITIPPDQVTQAGSLHGMASMIGIPSLPIAGLLISLSLARNRDWRLARKSLLWTALFMCLSLIFLFVVLGITLPKAGGFGPDVWIGWPNRILMGSYGLWLMTASFQAYKRQQT
jgi:MFS family permease